MNYNQFINEITESDADDWLYDDDSGRYVFKNNLAITIVNDRDFSSEFFEDWVNNYSDPTAYAKRFLLQYHNSTIEAFYAAAVDGYRMYIPYPRRPEMSITRTQFEIGRIINALNVGNHLQDYLSMAGISILK
ncbi:hypothetical protein [Paenibacillus wynnii]|uniref:Uncharacterized protein n=1 Tax=Paenibacillus wynnii TaxID=268407 RepID=A0A098M3M0_9BACL|nr:hypothetical protein [Paenibacillus wynnii]KGE16618.1 hypothetical protein PWYN_18060 [Paenibacillus wynnii]